MTLACRLSRTVRLLAVAFAALSSSSHIDAQSAPSSTFEVASVKVNRSGAPYIGGAGDRFSNGQFRTTNIPLRVLIRQAFERYQDDEVVGGPSWLDTDRWDIVAKAESPTAPMLPMIRTLLFDRFKLTTHHETRERPVYALVLARRDRRIGPSLREAVGPSSFRGSTGVVAGRAVAIRLLATLLGSAVSRPVIDRTGLTATYDVDLRWKPLGPNVPTSNDQALSDLPDIFTAVEEQLGLKLEPSKGSVDVLVIDHVERAAED
jgi:uncharacterized protein (TIGR03435 family)